MKSKDVIFKHLKEVGYNDEARIKICGYLTGIGIKENEEKILIAKGENTFADFLEWEKEEDSVSFFEKMLSSCKKFSKCQDCKEKQEEPKFKVGDWVRTKGDYLFKIEWLSQFNAYDANQNYFCINDIEPYYPKEGEFFCSTALSGKEWISCKGGYDEISCNNNGR